MNAPVLSRLLAPALLLIPLLPVRLGAQHVLLVQDSEKFYVVCAADGSKACVQRDGKVVTTSAYRFALKDVPEFLPAFVAVRNVSVKVTYKTFNGGPEQINNDFHFDAEFETGYRLRDVFVALALDTEEGGKKIFLWEVGELKPSKVQAVHVVAPMAAAIGSGRYTLSLLGRSRGPAVPGVLRRPRSGAKPDGSRADQGRPGRPAEALHGARPGLSSLA